MELAWWLLWLNRTHAYGVHELHSKHESTEWRSRVGVLRSPLSQAEPCERWDRLPPPPHSIPLPFSLPSPLQDAVCRTKPMLAQPYTSSSPKSWGDGFAPPRPPLLSVTYCYFDCPSLCSYVRAKNCVLLIFLIICRNNSTGWCLETLENL